MIIDLNVIRPNGSAETIVQVVDGVPVITPLPTLMARPHYGQPAEAHPIGPHVGPPAEAVEQHVARPIEPSPAA